MNAQSIVSGVRTGGRLPDISLAAAPDGLPRSFRFRGRDGRVVVLMHSADCRPCLDYLGTLAAAHTSLRDWDGQVLAVVPEGLDEAIKIRNEEGFPFPVLADPERLTYAKLGLGGGSILIADQWGELFLVEAGSEGVHGYPTADEVAEWLRFVAIQCPECQGEAK